MSGIATRTDGAEPVKMAIDEAVIRRGYSTAVRQAKQLVHPLTWPIFNLPGNRQQGLFAWFSHVANAWQIMHRREQPKITEESVDGLRIELDDGFSGKCTHAQTAAIVDTVERFHIPKQFVFEVLHGADLAYRFPQPETFDELLPTLAKLGGGTACGAMAILGAKPGFEVPAIRLGQALLLSYWLIQLDPDMRRSHYRLARRDFADSGLPANELSDPDGGRSLGFLTRLYGSRIESLFQQAHDLADCLDFDALRSVTALVEVVWEAVVQLMLEPKLLIDQRPVLTRFPHFRKQRWRFYLGLEPAQPFLSASQAHHH